MTTTPATRERVAKRPSQRRPGDIADQFKTIDAPRVGAYLRFSKGDDTKKLTIDAQLHDIKAYSALREWNVVETFIDRAKSASGDEHRPEWERLREWVASQKLDLVVVKRLDRFVRNKLDWYEFDAEFRKSGVQLVSIEEQFDPTTATGELMRDLTISFAVMELRTITKRNQDIARYRRESGMVPGVAPFGYRKIGSGRDATFEIVESEAKWLRVAASMIISGSSLREVARHLNAKSAPLPAKRSKSPRKRDEWTHLMIRQLLVRPTIAGLRHDPDDRSSFAPGSWTPIIEVETWQEMIDELSGVARQTHTPGASDGRKPKHLLSGILRCAHCGSKMRPRFAAHSKTSGRVLRYQCVSSNLDPNACNGPSIIGSDAHEHIERELFDAVAGRRLAPITFRDDDRAAAVQRDIDQLVELYESRKIKSVGEYMRLKAAAEAELAEIESEAKIDRRDSTIAKLVGSGAALADVWPSLSIETQRGIIREVFPVISCRKTGRGVRAAAVDKLTISDTFEPLS